MLLPLVEQAHLLFGEWVVPQQRHQAPIAERRSCEERRKLGDDVSRNRPLSQMEIVVHGQDGRQFDLALAKAPRPIRVRVANRCRTAISEIRHASWSRDFGGIGMNFETRA